MTTLLAASTFATTFTSTASASHMGTPVGSTARVADDPTDPEYLWHHPEEIDFPPMTVPPLPGMADPTYPELPVLWEKPGAPGNYFYVAGGLKTVGRTESVTNKQTIRLPLTQIAFGINFIQNKGLDPCTTTPLRGVPTLTSLVGAAVAMPGPTFEPDRPDRFGYFPPQTVHAVAFGAIPVTLRIQMVQPRDDHGVIEPLIATSREYKPAGRGTRCAPEQRLPIHANQSLKGPVDIHVLGMSMDGKPVDVGTSCQTSRPIEIDLTGPPFIQDATDPDVPPNRTAKYFLTSQGGYIKGAVEVPPFTGCGVGVEDLDPLITMSLSGKDTPLEIFQSPIGQGCFPVNRPNCDADIGPFPLDSDATY